MACMLMGGGDICVVATAPAAGGVGVHVLGEGMAIIGCCGGDWQATFSSAVVGDACNSTGACARFGVNGCNGAGNAGGGGGVGVGTGVGVGVRVGVTARGDIPTNCMGCCGAGARPPKLVGGGA